MARSPRTIMLCATRFWAGAGWPASHPLTTPTSRSGARHVARKQGVTPKDLDQAERELVRDGLLTKPRKGTIALTAAGVKASRATCDGVTLAPWHWQSTFSNRLDGAKPRRRKRRR